MRLLLILSWKRSLAATAQLQRGDGVRKRSPSDKQNPQIPDSHQGSDGRSSTKRTEADDKADSRNKSNNFGILAGFGFGIGSKREKAESKRELGVQVVSVSVEGGSLYASETTADIVFLWGTTGSSSRKHSGWN